MYCNYSLRNIKVNDMKVKLSILTTSDFPYGMASESFVRQMSLGLLENNAQLEIIRFWGNRLDNINDTSVKCTNYLFKKPFNNDFFKFIETFFQILYIPFFLFYRKLIIRDSVLLMYGLDRAYFVFPMTLFAKLFRIKTYRVITEVYSESTYAYKWWRKPNVLFNKWQVKYFDRYLDGVIVLSHFLKEESQKNGVDKNKILLIPHFIDLNIRNNLNSNQTKNQIIRIGFCGNPSIANGIIDLVIAYNELQNKCAVRTELVVMGAITDEVQKELNKFAMILRKIKFPGLLSKREVDEELSKCDILVNPRRLGIHADSGFPTKIGEYFATGKPVVSTKVGDLKLYFEDKKELVFAEANDPLSICDSLLFVIENTNTANAIAISGRQWAFDNLDYMRNSMKLLKFITKD